MPDKAFINRVALNVFHTKLTCFTLHTKRVNRGGGALHVPVSAVSAFQVLLLNFLHCT